jgi:PEP-CTERM motif
MFKPSTSPGGTGATLVDASKSGDIFLDPPLGVVLISGSGHDYSTPAQSCGVPGAPPCSASEPSSFLLLGSGVAGLASLRWRRHRGNWIAGVDRGPRWSSMNPAQSLLPNMERFRHSGVLAVREGTRESIGGTSAGGRRLLGDSNPDNLVADPANCEPAKQEGTPWLSNKCDYPDILGEWWNPSKGRAYSSLLQTVAGHSWSVKSSRACASQLSCASQL